MDPVKSSSVEEKDDKMGAGKAKPWQKSVEKMMNDYIRENFGIDRNFELKNGRIYDKETGEIVVDIPKNKLLANSITSPTAEPELPAGSCSLPITAVDPNQPSANAKTEEENAC